MLLLLLEVLVVLVFLTRSGDADNIINWPGREEGEEDVVVACWNCSRTESRERPGVAEVGAAGAMAVAVMGST